MHMPPVLPGASPAITGLSPTPRGHAVKAYSSDLRRKIVQAIDSGLPKDDVAMHFGVSVATINRYLKRRRETGSLAPKPLPGRPSTVSPEQHAALLELWRSHPDATLEETCRRWEEQTGQRLSPTTMCRMQQRLRWTSKTTV
jgi:transposase